MIFNIFNDRTVTYGANILGYLSRKVVDSNLGNPLGVGISAGLDVLGLFSQRIRNGIFARAVKGGGALYYGLGFAVPDAIEVFGGEYTKIPALFLDGSMACLLAKDAYNAYSRSGARVRDDLSSMVEGTRNSTQRIKDRF